MSKKLIKELPELVNAKIISEETAEKIKIYFASKSEKSSTNLVVVFGILGAILAGLGIILIIAHNWDDYSKSTKTVWSFIPLVIGQLACGYTLFRKRNNTAWIEGSSSFLFLAIGAGISLISQIYHLPGNISSLLFTWLFLGLPLVYIMRSSMASLLFIIGATYYGCDVGYDVFDEPEIYTHWLMLLLVIPHYVMIYRKNSQSNFTLFHNWFIPVSVVIVLGTVAKNNANLMYISYLGLFILCYLLGKQVFYQQKKNISKGYFVIGFLGAVTILMISSFRWFWEDISAIEWEWNNIAGTPEMLSIVILTLASSIILVLRNRKFEFKNIDPVEWTFIIYIIVFIIGTSGILLPTVIINVLVFIIGVYIIRKGALTNSLPVLNYGLLVITALIICRFFDSDMSYVLRGILFLIVGAGFFVSNIWMVNKRKKTEHR